MSLSRNNIPSVILKDPKSMTTDQLEEMLSSNKKINNYSNLSSNLLFNKYTPPVLVLNELQSINYPFKSRNFTKDDEIFKNNSIADLPKRLTNHQDRMINQNFLFEKMIEIKNENENLKESLMQTKEINEKEKFDLKSTFLQELNKNTQIDPKASTEILNKSEIIIKDLKSEINFLKNSLKLAESEKSKHLDQNIIEKEELKDEIKNLKREHENTKTILKQITGENQKLSHNQTLNEKTISDLKKEILDLKHKLSKTIYDYNNLIDDLKITHQSEINDFLKKNKVLQEIVDKNEGEHRKLVSNYEKKIKELKKDILNKDVIKNKPLSQTLFKKSHIGNIIKKNTKSLGNKSLSKSLSAANLKNKKSSEYNLISNNKFANSNINFDNNNPSDVSSVKDYKLHSMEVIETKGKSFVNNSQIKSTSNQKENPIKLFTTSEDIYKEKLTSINNNIFNLERENAELGRNVTNLINKKNQTFKEDQLSNIRSKITEKYLQIKKNDAKLEDFKSQQKNLLILSLNL